MLSMGSAGEKSGRAPRRKSRGSFVFRKGIRKGIAHANPTTLLTRFAEELRRAPAAGG